MDQNEINNCLQSLLDPISFEIIKIPVVLKCGHVFEKLQVLQWIEKNHNCPTCRHECNYIPFDLQLGQDFFVITDKIVQTLFDNNQEIMGKNSSMELSYKKQIQDQQIEISLLKQKLQLVQKSSVNQQIVQILFNIKCDSCQISITSAYFKCSICLSNYTWCEKCYTSKSHLHPFIRILTMQEKEQVDKSQVVGKYQTWFNLQKKSSTGLLLNLKNIHCYNCKNIIMSSIRFQCTNNSNINICMGCDSNYQSAHPMLVIKQLEFEEEIVNKIEVVMEGGVLIHKNTQCTQCAVTPIKGVRYQCPSCDNLHLCEKCEVRNSHYHPFLKINKLFDPNSQLKEQLRLFFLNNTYFIENLQAPISHPEVKCNNCKQQPIMGWRFKCTVCDDFNLCRKCEEAGHNHVMVKANNRLLPKEHPLRK